MTWLRLAWSNLSLSPLTTAVNVLLMALGTASIVLLLLASTQFAQTMSRDAQGIDLVIGAQGSPVQLVLSAVYHADVPTGNIKLAATERWAQDTRVDSAIPLSLGDSYRGYRIVGTTPQYLELYKATFAAGEIWTDSMQAVVGSAVAESTGLTLNATFAGAHGLVDGGHDHAVQPYRVAGVLAPTGTVLDRLVVTSLDSVWALHDESEHGAEHGSEHAEEHDEEHDAGHHDEEHNHDDAGHDEEHDHDAGHEEEHDHDDGGHDEEHDHGAGHDEEHDHDDAGHDDEHDHDAGHEEKHDHDDAGHDQEHGHDSSHADADLEITAMLLAYRTPLAAMTLPREINAEGTLQAAAPALEIARLLQLVGVGMNALGAFAWVLVITAALSIFAALYGSLRSRRGELAMLRCLGATRSELLLFLIFEGLLMSAMGVALGFVAGHGMMETVGAWLASTRGVAMTGWIWVPAETLLLFGLVGVGLLSAAIPAVQAYQTDVARTLVEG